MTHRASAALAALAAALAFCPVALADDGISMEAVGAPSYFVLHTHPGGRARGRVRIANLSDQPQLVRLQAADVGVAGTGGLAYEVGRPRATGRWMRPAVRTVALAGREQRVVAFTVLVPRRAGPGDHFAALTAETVPPPGVEPAAQDGVNVRFSTRMAIAVQLRLPGRRRPRLQVRRARVRLQGFPVLVLPMANRGTALLPGAELMLAVLQGRRRLFVIHQHLDAFVPHGRLRFEQRWPVPFVYGTYRLEGWVRAAGRRIVIHQRLRAAPPTRR